MEKNDFDTHINFLFKFYMLGYDHAIRVLKDGRNLTQLGKITTMRDYFYEQAKEAGLLPDDKET